MKRLLEKNYILVIILMLGFMASVSILNAKNDTLIYDEDAHIPAGYSYLTQHDNRLNPEHPPLIKDLAALPLLFLHPKFDTTQAFWNKEDADASQWDAGKSFLFGSGNNADQIIFWARLPIILIALVFGLFIFKWTKELAGTAAGLFALALYAFDPNVLGHDHLVTTDLGIAAFITFAFYYFIRFIKEPTRKNIFTAGFFLALAQLAKFSAVLIFPIFGLLVIAYPLAKIGNRSKLKSLWEYVWKSALVFAISLVIVWIVYYLNIYKMPQSRLTETMDHYFKPGDTRMLVVESRNIVNWLNGQKLSMPFADYVFGILRVFQRVGGGNVTYFMGQVTSAGYLSYFPIVFLIKEPLPTLLFVFFALALGIFAMTRSIFRKSQTGFFKKISGDLAHFIRTRTVEFAMISFITLYAAASITSRLNIGFRHLFPILPFMYILIAKTVFSFIKTRHNQSKHVFNLTVLILAILLMIDTISAYPYYLSYFNESVGGPKNGYHVVTDSNADWGQDLKRLKIWLDEYNTCAKTNDIPAYCYQISDFAPQAGQTIDKIKLDYFGMADVKYYLGSDNFEMWWSSRRPIEPGWYAISALFFQQGIYDKTLANDQSYRWLKNKQPFAQAGTSILIYHITPEEAAAANAMK